MLKKRKKWTEAEQAVLWEQYRSGDISVRTELYESYVPLVEIIATKIISKLPDSIEFGDLVSDGFIGLVDAVEKFDHSKGFKFETYASSRIWGEITDQLRSFDWVSRHSRLKFKRYNETIDILSERLQRTPTTTDIADELNWDMDEVYKIQSLMDTSFLTSLQLSSFDEYEDGSYQDSVADATIGESGFSFELENISDQLALGLSKLSEQESVIVYLNHYENMSFADIAKSLTLGASRVSQIYNDALRKLREEFA